MHQSSVDKRGAWYSHTGVKGGGSVKTIEPVSVRERARRLAIRAAIRIERGGRGGLLSGFQFELVATLTSSLRGWNGDGDTAAGSLRREGRKLESPKVRKNGPTAVKPESQTQRHSRTLQPGVELEGHVGHADDCGSELCGTSPHVNQGGAASYDRLHEPR